MRRSTVVRRSLPVGIAVALAAACALLGPFTQVYEDMSPAPAGATGRAESFEGGSSWVAPVSDGGFLVVGWPLASPQHLLLRRTDAVGTAIWARELADLPGTPYVYGARQVSDGGFVVWGYVPVPGLAHQAYVLKVSGAGDPEWTQTYGGADVDLAFRLVERRGGYVFAGATKSSGAGDFDVWVVLLDGDGNVVRADTFGGTGDDEAVDLDRTADGGFAVAAKNPSAGATKGQVEVLRYSAAGTLAWNVFLGTPGRSGGASTIAAAPDGGVFVSAAENVPDLIQTKLVSHLYKLGSGGALAWDAAANDQWRTWGGPLSVAADGSVVQVRSSSPQLGNTTKISFTRYAANGAQLATSIWPISAGAFYSGWTPYSVLATSDGGYVVLTAVYDQSVSHPFALVKMDAALQREWFTDWNGYPGGVHLAPTLDGWFVVCGLPPLPYPAGTETWLVRPDTDGSVQPPA